MIRSTSHLMPQIAAKAAPYNAVLPSSIQKMLQSHHDKVALAAQSMLCRENVSFHDPDCSGTAVEWPWLPGHIVKLNANNARVEGGIYLQDSISRLGLNLLRIPTQYTYEVPKTKTLLSIGEKIEGMQGPAIPIQLPHIKQLVQLIQNTGYSDPKWRNLVHSSDEKISIIDTELGSCSAPPLYGIASLLEKNTLTAEARVFFQALLRKISPYH